MLIELDDRCITFERPEKWVCYRDRLTIVDLARYYTAVSPWQSRGSSSLASLMETLAVRSSAARRVRSTHG